MVRSTEYIFISQCCFLLPFTRLTQLNTYLVLFLLKAIRDCVIKFLYLFLGVPVLRGEKKTREDLYAVLQMFAC